MNLHKLNQRVKGKDVPWLSASIFRVNPATTMKLATALLTFASLQLSATSYSQQVTLSKKNSSLNHVLHEIRQQSGYNVLYNSDLINSKGKIDVQLKNASLDEALSQSLEGSGLTYTIQDKTILIRPRTDNNGLNTSQQDSRPVKGRVLSSDKQPMAGVVISELGSNNKTQTDGKGYFELKGVKRSTTALVASYVGYETQQLPLNSNQNELNFNLAVQQNQLEEVDVVVSTGYQNLPKERATGSFSFVNEEKLKLTNLGSTNFAKGLEGVVPGLLVGQNGSMEIRGASSLRSATRNVLIVVDGFPVESGNFTINPNDIQSISVLKDAAAASIWGVRASNGVVVIVTKSGMATEGRAVFEVSSNLSIEEQPDFTYMNPASSSDYIDFEVETIKRGWINFSNLGNSHYSPVAELFYKKHLGKLTDAEVESGLDKLRSVNSLSQQDLFYRKAVQKQLNLSVRGGTEKYNFFISSFYTNQLTNLQGNKNDNFNLNFKNDLQVLPKLNLNLGVNSTFVKNIMPNDGYSFIDSRPYLLFLDDEGQYVSHSARVGNHLLGDYYNKGYYNWEYNPLQNVRGTTYDQNSFATRINVGANYQIMEGLKFQSQYQTELRFINGDKLQNMDTYFVRNLANTWRVYDANKGTYEQKLPAGPIFDKDKSRQDSWTFRNSLTLDRQFGADHTVSAIAGVELRSIGLKSNSERYYNYNSQALTQDIFNALAISNYTLNALGEYSSYTWNPNFVETKNRFFSAFANAAYTYLSKYTLSGSIRTDQSNLFGTDPKYRYRPLWSAGASWNIRKENFMQDATFLNQLILRATYGLNGNIGNSSPYPIATTGKSFATQENMLTFSNPENQFLRPEKTATTNFGVDFAMFERRISGSLDYYNRKSYDLLAKSLLDATTGFLSADRNTAIMNNHGIDLNLTGRVLTGEFKVDVDLNLGYNKNKVTDVIAPNKTATVYIAGNEPIKDLPLSYLYSYNWAGLSDKGEPQIYDADGNIHSWSKSRLTDVNALVYNGTMVPPFYGGAFIHFNYKGFTLSPQFTFKAGHKMRTASPRMDGYPRITGDIADRWRNPGDEAHTDIPRVFDRVTVSQVWSDYYQKSSHWIADASFIRLRSVTLNYRLPNAFIKNVFNEANVSVQANNFLLWSANEQGVDPDYVSLSTGAVNMPPAKNFIFSLNLKF